MEKADPWGWHLLGKLVGEAVFALHLVKGGRRNHSEGQAESETQGCRGDHSATYPGKGRHLTLGTPDGRLGRSDSV